MDKPVEINKTILCFIKIIQQLTTQQNSTVHVLIHSEKDLPNFLDKLEKVFKEEKLDFGHVLPPGHYNMPTGFTTRRMIFGNNSNQLKVWTLQSIQQTHPRELSSSENDWKNELITNLRGMPDEFYQEQITVGNCDVILDKYKQYIKL